MKVVGGGELADSPAQENRLRTEDGCRASVQAGSPHMPCSFCLGWMASRH